MPQEGDLSCQSLRNPWSWGLVRLDGDEVSAVVEDQAFQRVHAGLKAVDARMYVGYNSTRKCSHRCSYHRWLPAPAQTRDLRGGFFCVWENVTPCIFYRQRAHSRAHGRIVSFLQA